MDSGTMASLVSTGNIQGGCVLGRYELLMPIATGGMAIVWAARLRGSRGFQKIVAIKTIRPEMSADPSFEAMLLDEASLASRIRHPQVVEILDLGEENGVPYIVMEWINGESLLVVMKEAAASGGIPLPVSVRLGTQLCAGLHAAHELRNDEGELVGLVHRDVSPQNVLVTRDGVAKLVDFGIAKAIGRAAGETMAGKVKGKTAYLSPEQARGGSVDRRSDVFATGTLLYAMTTGKHPFRGVNDFTTLTNLVAEQPPPRPSKFLPGFPPQLEKVIMTALEKDPARRFQTANDMLRELDRSLPSNKRMSTDEEVAAFIRPLVGSRFETMRTSIKEALRVADERLAGADSRKSFTTEAVEAFIEVRMAAAASPGRELPADGAGTSEESSSDSAGSGSASTLPDPEEARGSVSGIVGRLRGGAEKGSDSLPAAPTAESAVANHESASPRSSRLGIGIAAGVSLALAIAVMLVITRSPRPPQRVANAEPVAASARIDPVPVACASAAQQVEAPQASATASAAASAAPPPSASSAVPPPRTGKQRFRTPRYTPSTI